VKSKTKRRSVSTTPNVFFAANVSQRLRRNDFGVSQALKILTAKTIAKMRNTVMTTKGTTVNVIPAMAIPLPFTERFALIPKIKPIKFKTINEQIHFQ
jgi:hypothetical protein